MRASDSRVILDRVQMEPMPRPMTETFAQLRARLEAQGVQAAPEPPLEPFKAHAAFDRERDSNGVPRYEYPSDCPGMLGVAEKGKHLWLLACDQCSFEVHIPVRRVDPKVAIERLVARAGIPERFRDREFDASDAEQQEAVKPCREWLRRFEPGDLAGSLPAPALWGEPGRGKTHLLSMMVGVVIRRHGVDAMYRSTSAMFDEIQDFEGAAEHRWQRLLDVRVLALDDLGAARLTDWRQDRLFALIDHRINRDLPMLVATNLPPDRWPEAFGDRAASRLRGLVVPFRLGGPDRREQTELSIPF